MSENPKRLECDVLVVGGGINGVGIARDACMPAMTAASTQPESSPVRSQSPARNRFSRPEASLARR